MQWATNENMSEPPEKWVFVVFLRDLKDMTLVVYERYNTDTRHWLLFWNSFCSRLLHVNSVHAADGDGKYHEKYWSYQKFYRIRSVGNHRIWYRKGEIFTFRATMGLRNGKNETRANFRKWSSWISPKLSKVKKND